MLPSPDSVQAQMRKGILEFCVLAHLRRGPSYGREIAGVLSRESALLTSEGTLYPLLARLRKQGWVETSRQASELGPPRRYYTLTADGSAALETFTAAWGPFSRSVTTILEDSR
jgi:PadR family transcriptional regulator, regulatory protein PadR